MARFLQVLFIILLVISSTRFFGADFINESVVNYSQFVFAFLAIAASVPFLFQRQVGFVLPVQLMTLAIVVSVFMAYISWDQSFKDSLIVTVPLLLWPFFFFLNRIKISVLTVENIVLFYGLIYLILSIYQYTHPGIMLFGRPNWGDEFHEDRGVIRIAVPGAGIFFLAVFIALNRLTSSGRGKVLWLLFVIFGLVIPVLQVTRMLVAGVLLIYFFHFMKNANLLKKIVTFVLCIFLISYIFNSELKPVKGMIEAQKEAAQEGENYIRVLCGKYFLTEFSPSDINRVLGNGVPYWNVSYYGKVVEELNYRKAFYLEDIGIISIYVMYGIFGVIAYGLIWIKSLTIKIPEEYHYVKYSLWFLLINGLTTSFLYLSDYLISTVLALYIYQTIYVQEKIRKQINDFYRSATTSEDAQSLTGMNGEDAGYRIQSQQVFPPTFY